MFCTKCGAPLAEGQAFCTKCGAPAPAAPVAEPVAPAVEAQPVQPEPVVQPEAFVPPAPVYAPYTPPQPKVGKQAFLTKLAPAPVKTCAWVAWVVTVACIALLVGGWFSMLNTSIEDIPVIASVAGDSTDALDEAKEELEKALDEAEKNLDEFKEELSEEDYETLEEFLETAKDMSEDISIDNMSALIAAAQDLADIEFEGETLKELDDITESMEGMAEAEDIFNTLKTISLVMLLLFAAFTLFGGLFRIRGLVIPGMILTALYTLPFMGTLFVVGNILLHVALIVLLSVTTSAYKKYRRSV